MTFTWEVRYRLLGILTPLLVMANHAESLAILCCLKVFVHSALRREDNPGAGILFVNLVGALKIY